MMYEAFQDGPTCYRKHWLGKIISPRSKSSAAAAGQYEHGVLSLTPSQHSSDCVKAHHARVVIYDGKELQFTSQHQINDRCAGVCCVANGRIRIGVRQERRIECCSSKKGSPDVPIRGDAREPAVQIQEDYHAETRSVDRLKSLANRRG